MRKLFTSRSQSIARRLAEFSIVFVTASVIAASITLYLIVASVVREQIDQRLDTQIEGLRSALEVGRDGAVMLGASLDGPPFDRRGSGWYWQVSGDGVHISSRSLAGGDIDSPPAPFDWRRALSGEPRPVDGAKRGHERLHLREASAVVGTKVVRIIVSAPASALSAPARRALLWLVPLMTLLGGTLIVGILLQVRFGLRPIRQMTSDISKIAAGTLSRLPDIDVEELAPASQEINRLVDQNLQRLAYTRLHFANLAHGLKTPVSSLSLALDADNDPTGDLRNLVGRIDQRIRHHLARARKTVSGATSVSAQVRPCIDDLLLIMSRLYVDRSIKAEYRHDEDSRVLCAPEDLEEILGNVIDNAFKWAGGVVKVSTQTAGAEVIISIEDDGPGLDDARIADAFSPGIRLDETIAGDGFGLSIASELAQLYGGRLSLANVPNGGAICSVTLPRAAAERTLHDAVG